MKAADEMVRVAEYKEDTDSSHDSEGVPANGANDGEVNDGLHGLWRLQYGRYLCCAG